MLIRTQCTIPIMKQVDFSHCQQSQASSLPCLAATLHHPCDLAPSCSPFFTLCHSGSWRCQMAASLVPCPRGAGPAFPLSQQGVALLPEGVFHLSTTASHSLFRNLNFLLLLFICCCVVLFCFQTSVSVKI